LRRRIADLTASAQTKHAAPLDFAYIYARLGDKEQALAWLEKACEERSGPVYYLKVDAAWDPLRSDPRFNDLLRRVGLGP